MPPQKYKALIFDLGNVIIDISPKNPVITGLKYTE